MGNRYVLLDAKNGNARYTIIDTKVIIFDAIEKTFWLDVGSFNENPLDSDGIADILKVDHKTYNRWKSKNFSVIGEPIPYKELPIQAKKFVGYFIWRKENGESLDGVASDEG